MKKAGLNVDYQAMDWGTVVQRRAKKDPPDQGGWSVFFTFWAGLDMFSPAADPSLRGNGTRRLVRLAHLPRPRGAAPGVARRARPGGAEEDRGRDPGAVLQDVPYFPLGQLFQPIAYRDNISGVLNGGFVLFWNVQKA